MASIFLSYDHEDAARAAPLAAALEANGHSVWWDRHIHGGAEYNSEIENAVERSDALIVLWSEKSVRSAWVRDEAAEGRDAGKLVPVLIDSVKPPMGFRQYQTIDLVGWNGGKRIARLPDLLNAIDKVAKIAPAAVAAPPAPAPEKRQASALPAPANAISRRLLIGSGAAAAAAMVGGGIWWSTQARVDPRFEALLDKAREAIAHNSVDEQTVRTVEQAVAMQPASAEALGLLALVESVVAQEPHADPAMVSNAERTARRALSIDPKEPNALLAMFELQGSALDWFTRDQNLRKILAIAPKNVGAMSELILLLQATGFVEESWDWNERAVALEPLSPEFLGRRAFKLWIRGRVSEADKVIDQVRALYPASQWGWYVRFKIYAYSGRASAALAMFNGNPAMSERVPQARFWRPSLQALDQPSPANVAKARAACIEGARISAGLASEAVQVMSALGQLDPAFDISNGVLLSRGPIVLHESATDAAQDASWRVGTQWMFTPPAAPMRSDPRFLPLCQEVGLAEYWRKRGMKPDYQRA